MPSPVPQRVVQLRTIQKLVDLGVLVVCCGGGGIPVVASGGATIHGIEAVIDKDRVSALLGVQMGADKLFLTTGTDAIYADFNGPNKRRLTRVTVTEIEAMAEAGEFPPGSMGPKVEAAVHFLRGGGTSAVVCSPSDLVSAFHGDAGTEIVLDG